MNKFKLILLFLLISLPFFAQIEVVSFEHLQTDLTANTKGSTVYDQNGDKCALIKIRTVPVVVKDFIYDVGRLGIVETKFEGAETWLYVPHSVHKISIQHPKFGFLDKYELGISVKKGQTYLLTLKVGSGQATIVETDEQKEQYLIFSVEPKNALLQVNGEFLILRDGVASKKMPLGVYDYRVEAPDFHAEVGKVTLSNPDEPTKVSVTLRPAFGWLDLSGKGNFDGAWVFLDRKQVGIAPLTTDKLPSGEHTLLLMKDKYNPYEVKITIPDNDTLKMTPHLVGNFAMVEIQAVDGAEIWVNNEIKGVSYWKGELEHGLYKIDAKKENYYTTSTTCEVGVGDTLKSVIISDLRPIYGRVDIQVSPSFSQVYVDGEYKGETPYYHDLIIGKHLVEVKSEGRASLREEIVLHEGETRKISGELRSGPVKVKIASPLDVNFYVDGKKKGFISSSTPWIGNLPVGIHEFEFKRNGYESQKINVDVYYDGQQIVVPELQAYLYEVACYVTPDSSDIYIDNQHMGVTPLILKLPLGAHKMKVSKYGMLPMQRTIHVMDDNKTMISGELKKASRKEMQELSVEYSDGDEFEYMEGMSMEDSISSLKGYKKTMQSFYYSAGKYELTVVRAAGNFASESYNVELSALDFRIKMIEFSLLNFSLMGDYYEKTQCLSYTPSLRLHVPLTRVGTIFFGAAPVVVFSDGYITDVFYKATPTFKFQIDGGFRIDTGRAFGLDFFARYRYEQGFSAGLAIHFSTNGKRARDLRNK